jgi:hypothetical protein
MSLKLLSSRGLGHGSSFRVNLDPMSANFGPFLSAHRVKNNEIGLLVRHVAVNAVAGRVVIELGE